MKSKITIGPLPAMFVALFEPTPGPDGGGTLKYRSTFIWPKKDKATTKAVIGAIIAAAEEGVKKNIYTADDVKTIKTLTKVSNIGRLKNLQPLRDGDYELETPGTKKKPEDWAGMYYFNANAIRQPGMIDLQGQQIINEDEMYSGVPVKAQINFYPWNKPTKRVCAGLNNLLKTGDGERRDGIESATSAFADDIDMPDVELDGGADALDMS